jgi:predicted CoA-substrate-specific enzyme activase
MLGIDLGSRYVKIVEMTAADQDPATIRSTLIDTVAFYRTCGRQEAEGLRVDFSGLGFPDTQAATATGYGKITVPIAGARQIPEIKAHVRGALGQSGLEHFTLLDIGGQDTKVVKVQNGRMVDFRTNDRCAASSGRYVENMAAVLGVDLEEMGRYSEDAAELSSTCAIFGETEIIGKIVAGYTTAQLIAGVNRSLYRRVAVMLEQLSSAEIVLSGGGALNAALAAIIQRESGHAVRVLPEPQLNGAIGCCLTGFDLE